MVDEKLDDQVWVTVVATGFDGPRRRREDAPFSGRQREQESAPRRPLREPAGEPRVSRVRERARSSPRELDVPEFIPRR
jgi:cell division protein FtsZ